MSSHEHPPAGEISKETEYEILRRVMVEEQLARRGIRDERVLEAMRRVPRHEFVPEEKRVAAYSDQPLAIGGGQTISQPYIVAAMSEALELTSGDRVLEVGTGSGYQAAVLARLAREVYSIEIHPLHAEASAQRLARMGYGNVHVRGGDGARGWPEQAPFDAIMVTAAAPQIPPLLEEQLAEGGRMIVPVGDEREQQLIRIRKLAGGRIAQDGLSYCRFVPLRGEYGWTIPEWMQP